MLDLLSHLSTATYLPDLAPEVAYSVFPSLYYGPSRSSRPGELRTKSVALTNPAYVRKQQALGLAVEGYEPPLVRYYQQVLRVLQQHGKELRAHRQYVGMRPVLLGKGQPVVSFPWYDTYPETARVLRALQAPVPEGLLLDDLDQGWEVAIYAQGSRIYVAEGDGERTKPYACSYTDRARLAELAAATLARTQRQLALFVRETGQNPWQFTSPAPRAGPPP